MLDESPVCVKHIIHVLLKGATYQNNGGLHPAAAATGVAADEEAYLLYISHVLKLSNVIPTRPNIKGMMVKGGSTIASPLQLPRWSKMLQDWCPGHPAKMSLLYRASRDGFSTAPFQTRVRGVRRTVTLIRVTSGGGRVDSVVGGFTDIELVPRQIGIVTGHRSSSASFLFLLDSPDESSGFQPVEQKWSVKQGEDSCAIHWPDTTDDCAGPAFGLDDMCVTFGKEGGSASCTLSTRREFYDVDESSPFLGLDGENVAEIEVFRVDEDAGETEEEEEQPAPVATTPSQGTAKPGRRKAHCPPGFGTEMEEKYVRKFGASLAELLMEEQLALAYAQAELREANSRAAAAARAVAVVYGPDIARGEEDRVVELSVRGMSVTTLLSTLKACPESVFSSWFGEQGSESESDDESGCGKGGLVDEDGCYKVDCDPNCFSKILDVMRMRKRDSWTAGAERDDEGYGVTRWTVRIPVPEDDRRPFKEAVRAFFPGCEEYIMGLIEPWNDVSAGAPTYAGSLYRAVSWLLMPAISSSGLAAVQELVRHIGGDVFATFLGTHFYFHAPRADCGARRT